MAELKVPEVPYQAYPTVTPQGQLPALHVDTPAAAFGANVAGAVEHLGGTLSHVGDELFQRAIQMKQIENETEANNATNAFMGDASEKAEKFKSQLGVNANSDALHAFNTDLQEHRDKIRSGLSNPAVQRAYDAATRGVQRQYMSQASGHSATETKRATINSMDAKEKLDDSRLEQDPTNLALQDELVGTGRQDTAKRKELLGWDDNMAKLHDQERTSRRLGIMAQSIGNTDPDAGYRFLEEHKKEMSSEAYLKAHDHMAGVLTNVTTRNGSAAVNSFPQGIGAPAWLHQNEIGILNSIDTNASAVFNQTMLNHPEYRGVPTAGEQKSLDYMVQGDTERTIQGLQEAADQLGIKIKIEHDEDHVHFELDPSQDPRDIPQHPQEQGSSRAARLQSFLSEEYPNYPNMPAAGYTRAQIGFSKAMSDQRMAENNAALRIYGFISPEGQGKAQDEDELRERIIRGTGNTKLWDTLNEKQKYMFRHIMASKDAVKDDTREWWRLSGMDPADLVSMNPMDIVNNDKLTKASKHALLQKWQRAMNAPEGNPMVNRAISIMKNNAPTLDIWKNDDYNKEHRDILKGALQDILIAHADIHKAPAKTSEITEYGNKLLQMIHIPGFFGDLFGGTDVPAFEAPVSVEERERERVLPYWDNRQATDEAVDRVVRVKRMLNLEGGKEMLPPGAGPRPPEEAVQPPMPTVPRPPEPVSVPSGTKAFTGGERRPGQKLSEAEIVAQEREIAARVEAREQARRAVVAGRGGVGKPSPTLRTGLVEREAAQKAQILKSQLEYLDRQEEHAKTIKITVFRERELARIERDRKALKGE